MSTYTRTTVPYFHGKVNVTKSVGEDGSVNYFCDEQSLQSSFLAAGAEGIDTYQSEKKHVFFLTKTNPETKKVEKVASFNMQKPLHGKSVAELGAMGAKLKTSLSWFEDAYNALLEQVKACTADLLKQGKSIEQVKEELAKVGLSPEGIEAQCWVPQVGLDQGNLNPLTVNAIQF